MNAHPGVKVATLVEAALEHPARIAVITGGEPTMHQLDAITHALKAKGFRTHMETAATSPITGSWDWITISPKKFKAPVKENLPLANELKVVIFHPSDFKWAESFAPLVSKTCKLYLQPEWSKQEKMTPLIIDYIGKNPQWQLSLQTHKFVHIR